MTSPVSDTERIARATLTWVGDPGDELLGALVAERGACAVLEQIRSGDVPAGAWPWPDAAGRSAGRWRAALAGAPRPERVADMLAGAVRVACPGDPEWPPQLGGLGDRAPVALWLRGRVDLRFACLRSVAVAGSRAATAYGAHVAVEMAGGLAGQGWAVVSGGAFGIDAAAHRGALSTGGVTIAVLACGVDQAYPAAHASLFDAIADRGLLVSEWPPPAGRTSSDGERAYPRERLSASCPEPPAPSNSPPCSEIRISRSAELRCIMLRRSDI